MVSFIFMILLMNIHLKLFKNGLTLLNQILKQMFVKLQFEINMINLIELLVKKRGKNRPIMNASYFECSNKDNENVNEIFEFMISEILKFKED